MANLCDSTNVMNKVRNALLSENKINIKNLFSGEKTLAFKHSDEDIKLNYSLTKSQISTLLRMSLFHLLQNTEKQALTEDNNHNCKIIIISLLHMAKDSEPENQVSFLKECANSIFKNPLVLQFFLPVYKKKDFTEKMFTDTFQDICVALYAFSKECICVGIICAYREKFISLLKSTVEKCKTRDKMKHLVKAEFFQILQLHVSEMVHLLSIIVELPNNKFLSSEKTCLSIWGITVPKLMEACLEANCIYDKNVFPLDVNLFKKLLSCMIELKSCKVDVVLWETAFYKYLQRFPHSIGDIDMKTFVSLMQNESSPATIKMISLLINRSAATVPQFIKIARKNPCVLQRSSIIFPILESNLTYNWDKQFLSKLCELHKKEIIDYITEPAAGKNSWIQENVKAVMYLIDTNFDKEICQQICNIILVNGDKLDNVDIQYVQLLESFFKKIKAFREFLQVLIHLMASTLKHCKNKTSLSKNKKKLEFLCQTLLNTVETLKIKERNFIFEELSKNHSWSQFVRFSLTQGLKLTEAENSLDNALLLRALIAACSVAYNDNGTDEYVKTIFGLATTHSEYADIMLSSTSTKRYLVELILTLVRKNTAAMLPNHIPFYLAAYNATLSESDQILLLIIKQYETCNINLSKYRPFLWGNAAASHYSVKEDPNTALFRQPKTSQILDLFVPEMVNNTITRFPVQRSLKSDTLCAPENVYDPVFYLPVLCEVLSVHNPVAYHKVTHNGSLGLMLIACCSNCDQIRLAAYTDLSRFYFHLENLDVKRSNERLLWIRFIDALRNGIVELGISEMTQVCLNGFVATFLARASMVGTQPLHPLYWPLHKFFMAKPALKLNTIPEFKKLFHSPEVDYEAHRCWILQVIRDGFKSENDLQIAINCSVFNILQSFYASSLSDKPTRKLILEIINSIAKIRKSGLLLVNHYGVMPWLDAITDRLGTCDSDFVPLLIDITRNFVDSFSKTKGIQKYPLFVLMHVLLTLGSAMTSKNITVYFFTSYVDTLERILVFKDLHLSEKHVKYLLQLSKELLGSMTVCEDLLDYGPEFASKETDDLSKDEVSIARKSMRKLILRWHSRKKSLPKNERLLAYPDGSVCKIPSMAI